MKRLTIASALLAAFALILTAFIAAEASGAESESVWLCGERTIPRAKECLVLGENLENVIAEDMGIPARIECTAGGVLAEGWAGPGAEGEVTSVSFVSSVCTAPKEAENLAGRNVENQCLRILAVRVLNLPWKTLIVLVGSEAFVLTTDGRTGGSSQPGYEFECEGLLGARVKDKCFSQEAHSLLDALSNLPLEGSEFPLVAIIGLLEPPEGELEYGNCEANIVGNHEKDALLVGEGLAEAFLGGNPASLEWSES